MEGDVDAFNFYQDDLFCTSFSALEAMRKREELCDITINIENHSFVAHRAILAAGIPYFRSVFTRSGRQTEKKEITVEDLDPTALETLIGFAYSGKVNISLKNVQSLLTASKFLELDQVHDACVEFLSERIRIGNASQVLILGLTLNNLNLIERSNHYIRQNFVEFSKSEGFLSLPHSCVKEIVSDDRLNAPSEEIVFEAVMNWVKNSPLDRHFLLPDLLSEVRMIFLPVDYWIKRFASEELITSSIPCRDLLEEVKTYHLLPKDRSPYSRLTTASRKSMDNEDIYAVCESINSEISVHRCDFVTGSINFVSKKHYNGLICHVVAANGIVYIFLHSQGVLKFHVKTSEWAPLDTIYNDFQGTAVSLHGNVIYCFGCHSPSSIDKVRCFSIQKNKWLNEGRMKTPRLFAAAASLGEDIYVTGGSRNFIHTSTVDKYNPLQDQWSEIPSMLTPRFSHACTTMNGKLYVCGGLDDRNCIRSAEVYDPLTNEWNYISSMKNERFKFSLLTYNNKIYALAGVTSMLSGTCTSTEMYDPETGEWHRSVDTPTGFIFAASMSPVCDLK